MSINFLIKTTTVVVKTNISNESPKLAPPADHASVTGDSEIKTFWKDPEFRQDQDAFYYSRVLENPTCRWSTCDAMRDNESPRSDIPATIQERAWSSPIWYTKKYV